MGERPACAETDFFVENTLQEILGVDQPLHVHVGLAVMHELHRCVCSLHVIRLVDDLKACQIHVHAASDLSDLCLVTDQDGIGDALFLCSLDSLQYRLILGYSDSNRLAVALINLLQ